MSLFVENIARAFPTPNYLSMSGAGVDISPSSVKSVLLENRGGMLHLAAYHKMDLEEGVVFDGDIEMPEKMTEVLRALRKRARIHFAHVSLLEKKAYLYQTIVPAGTKDFRAAAEFSLEGNVPVPPGDVLFDFEIVRSVEAGTIIAVTAYAKRIVTTYSEVFQKAGITLRSLEVESQAAARAVLGKEHNNKTVLLVDFGKDTTRIAVADNRIVSFSATVDVGGDSMTSAIMKHAGLTAEEAEKIKNEQGFLEGGSNRELYEALMSTVSVLRDELLRHITYWNTSDDNLPRRPIERVVIMGGNANLKGLPEFLSRALGIPVIMGNPWANAFSLDRYIPPMPAHESIQYAATVGLALRSHARAW